MEEVSYPGHKHSDGWSRLPDSVSAYSIQYGGCSPAVHFEDSVSRMRIEGRKLRFTGDLKVSETIYQPMISNLL